MLSLARYIHQNPVKAGMVQKAGDYRWSSYSSYLNKDDYFSKLIDTNLIMGLFSNDKKVAMKKFEEFMNEKTSEAFLDISEKSEVMEEEAAVELFEQMLMGRKLEVHQGGKVYFPDELIRDFRVKTKLSIRKIAEITGLNKDRVNKILKR